ncbi:MAG: zinc-ribbon domain-containing protein [Chloroflexi bacterium]|nr:zinc-ribbon domain-containing protein [Chloroflexota bacterium]
MIIFGTSARTKTIGEGLFYCPNCQETRRYELKQARQFFSLYFIPLIPLGEAGRFVLCQTCGMAFQPDVLNMKPQEKPPDLAGLINTAKARLEGGYPVEYLVRDLTAAGLDREVAWATINAVVGVGRRTCPNCRLSYAATVTVCPECGHSLDG